MSAALLTRIEARIIETERERSRAEMLRARELVPGLDAVIAAQREVRIEDDLTRLWAQRKALLRGMATAATTDQGAA